MVLPMPIPKWHPDPQEYAVGIQRASHDQALAHYGEYTIFVLMWKTVDFEAGLVARCPTCYGAYGKMAEAYGQSAQEKCPDCFGTSFEGGYKAKIARLALWDMQEEEHREEQRRGVETANTARVQSTSDFRLRTNDYALRADGTRWRVQNLDTNHIRSGFQMPNRERTPVGYNFGTVVREKEGTVAYLIPPLDLSELDLYNIREPADLSSLEDIRGSLT